MRLLKKWFNRAEPTEPMRPSLQARFTEVYEQRLWGSAESASGLGSEKTASTVTHSLNLLRNLIQEHGIRSISDVPCGDFNWMPALLEEFPDLDYIGYDVVQPLIEENQRRYPSHLFQVLDITTEVPRQSDLIFSKDLLNHLNFDDVWAALSNMVASGARYVMVTNNAGFENVELEPTQPHASRYLDLFAAPFFLPASLNSDHYLLVWERETLAEHLRQRD